MKRNNPIELARIWPVIEGKFVVLHFWNGESKEVYAQDKGEVFDYIITGQNKKIYLAAIKRITFAKC
jgi:hypothetical protein